MTEKPATLHSFGVTAMKSTGVTVEFKRWMIEQVQSGVSPQALLAPMVAVGWDEHAATERDDD